MNTHSAASRLQALQQSLRDRLQRIHADEQRALAPLSADFSEQAVETENDEVLARLETATAQDLAQVEHALRRLAEGHYGRCESCGTVIEAARLQALPQATHCSACAAATR